MIDIHEAKKRQAELHRQATRFLEQAGISDYIDSLGDVLYVGSYASELLVKPDIDIQIIAPNADTNLVMQLTKFFFEVKNNYSVEIADGTEYRRSKGHPLGYYVGGSFMFEGVRWPIDIWILHEPQKISETEYTFLTDQFWFNNLDQGQRDTILLLKHQLYDKDEYNKFGSVNVYQSVLSGHVETLEDFYAWAGTNDDQASYRRQ